MEHANPLLRGNVSPKFITIGEIMLRLTPPNYGKIRVADTFEASYGGSEANIALALANLGVDSTFFSVPQQFSGQERRADALQQRCALHPHDSLHTGRNAHSPPGDLLSGDRLRHPPEQSHL